MTLYEDAIYDLRGSLCAETKDVVASAIALKPDLRSTFIVRR